VNLAPSTERERMTLLGGFLLYLGLAAAAAGAISILKPSRFLRIRTRKRGLLIVGAGFLSFTIGVYLPVRETRVETASTRLDEFAPVFQFSEFHEIAINAPKDRVYAALQAVTPEEIRFYDTLTWLRRFGRPSPAGILNPPSRRPILEMFTNGAFFVLAEEPGREVVFGHAGDGRKKLAATPDDFKRLHPPRVLKIAMNFRIQETDAAHCLLTTETRVYAAGPQVLHGFAAYWRMIQPGSALIRRMWLRAIKLRAEAGSASPHFSQMFGGEDVARARVFPSRLAG
jgi:hypothetical protein